MSISEAGFFNLLHSLKQFRNLLESALEMKNGCCCSQPVWLEYIKLTLVTAGVGGSSTHPTWGSYESWNRFEGSHEGDYHAGFLFSSWDNFTSLHKIHFWPMDTRNGFFVVAISKKKCIFTHTSPTHQLFALALLIHLSQEAASTSPSPGLHEELTAALNICTICGWTCWVLARTKFSQHLQQGLSVFQAGSSIGNLKRDSFLFIP